MRFLIVLIVLACMPAASAATIYGTVYDVSLQPVSGAIVTVNTTPEQTCVSVDGEYSLDVPQGTFLLRVDRSATVGLLEGDEKRITVAGEGPFLLDFLLFPEIQEYDEPDLSGIAEVERVVHLPSLLAIVGLCLLVIGLIVVAFTKHRPKGSSSDNLSELVAGFIRKEGTTTQKDVREAFPYSEAKMSLVISALVSEGKVKKVKRGRGNMLIWVK